MIQNFSVAYKLLQSVLIVSDWPHTLLTVRHVLAFWLAHTWFLKLHREVGTYACGCVCMCVSTPRLLKTIHVK